MSTPAKHNIKREIQGVAEQVISLLRSHLPYSLSMNVHIKLVLLVLSMSARIAAVPAPQNVNGETLQ